MPIRHAAATDRSPKSRITCERVTALVLDYVSGGLDRETTLAFRKHLRRCQDCIAFLNTYKKSVRATRSLRYQEIPAELEERVRQFLRKRTDHRPRGC
jgi:anti-sigma factor RsiW